MLIFCKANIHLFTTCWTLAQASGDTYVSLGRGFSRTIVHDDVVTLVIHDRERWERCSPTHPPHAYSMVLGGGIP